MANKEVTIRNRTEGTRVLSDHIDGQTKYYEIRPGQQLAGITLSEGYVNELRERFDEDSKNEVEVIDGRVAPGKQAKQAKAAPKENEDDGTRSDDNDPPAKRRAPESDSADAEKTDDDNPRAAIEKKEVEAPTTQQTRWSDAQDLLTTGETMDFTKLRDEAKRILGEDYPPNGPGRKAILTALGKLRAQRSRTPARGVKQGD